MNYYLKTKCFNKFTFLTSETFFNYITNQINKLYYFLNYVWSFVWIYVVLCGSLRQFWTGLSLRSSCSSIMSFLSFCSCRLSMTAVLTKWVVFKEACWIFVSVLNLHILVKWRGLMFRWGYFSFCAQKLAGRMLFRVSICFYNYVIVFCGLFPRV